MKRLNARLVVCLLICLCISVFAGAEVPLLRVTFLDVGQGDCALIRTKDKTIMIDAGDDRYDAATAVIIPYLKKEGIRKIDLAIISHPHRDHFAGFIDLLQAVDVTEVYYSNDNAAPEELKISRSLAPGKVSGEAKLYGKMLDIIREKNIKYTKAEVGDTFDWGAGVHAEVFHAESAKEEDEKKVNQNNNSIIMKITAGEISYLFSGDAEIEAEKWTVDKFSKLKCTVMKSGHHGSKTSSSAPFLESAQPEFAVIPVGKNSFGHPTPSTLAKYDYYGIKYFRTDLDGTIDSHTDGKTLKFVTKASPLEITEPVKLISLTANSATLRWKTNKAATTEVYYGLQSYNKDKKSIHPTEVHTVTLTGLRSNTKYFFRAVSTDPRQSDKVVEFKSTITTLEGSDTPLPSIEKMMTNYKKIYMRHPFKVSVPVINPADAKSSGISLSLYHSAMDEANLINKMLFDSLESNSSVNTVFPTEITWLGDVELIAVLRKGKSIIDTMSLNITVLPKLLMVDCAHGNIDYFTGRFSGMKMDLYQHLGFQMKSISKSITYTKIKTAFVVAIPSPRKDFKATEISALQRFVSEGGSVMLFSQADYKNYSNPQFLNNILAKVGSKIRFNDDQVQDVVNAANGSPWRFLAKEFPTQSITPKEVKQLYIRSGSSLLNSKLTGLQASKNLYILSQASKSAFNTESDGMNDGYIYASHTPVLQLPMVACEDLGFGRVACFGEKLYNEDLYNVKSKYQTPAFNRTIVHWLSLGKDKKLKELFSYTDALALESNPVVRTRRIENMNRVILNRVRRDFDVDPYTKFEVNTMLEEFNSPSIQPVKSRIQQMIQFDRLHAE